MLRKHLEYLWIFFVGLMIIGCNTQDKSLDTIQQSYPLKPITMIVPYTAGGTADMMARAMEKDAGKYLGQPLVIMNIPGGGATIGWNELASAKHDGYTLGIITTGCILQPLYGSTRYHYSTALDPLVQIASMPVVIAVSSNQPWKNINDLVEYAKSHPGEIKYGHPGLGTVPQIVGELFAKEAGVNIAQVPFRGDSESLAALLGGHVQMIFIYPSSIKEYVMSNNVRALAIASKQRLNEPVFNSVPTLKEQELDIVFDTWWGVGAPKMMPKEVRNRLTKGLSEMLNDPVLKKKMEATGMTLEYLGPDDFAEKWSNETVKLTKVINETGIAEKIASQKN